MKVTGIYRIGLGVSDLGAAQDFYLRNWGMGLAASDGGIRYFKSKRVDHCDLAVSKARVTELDHIALGVRSEADLNDAVLAVERAGFKVLQKVNRGSRPGDALCAAVQDPDGNRVELVVPAIDEPATILTEGEAIGPSKIGHAVLWTPQPEQQEAFYRLLGFNVSDRTHMGMSFLRCNSDHHTLAFAYGAHHRAGLQHVAFDVGSLDNVMLEFGRLRSEGIACIWGVGRHGPGNNIFSYYRDPAGNVVEFYGEMEQVADGNVVETRIWGPEHKGDIWGVAGAAPAQFRD